MTELNLKPSAASLPQSKPIPTESVLKPWIFNYAPSPDGNDLNLLIFFHGLGDTKKSFSDLGKKLNLPGTAVLALQAPDPIPLLEHPAFSWYNTFTQFFEPLPNPNPTTVIPPLRKLIENLISPEIGWSLTSIHLFGFAQGGTTALELALDLAKRFGSVTSICAPLLASISSNLHLHTPICYFTRQDQRSAVAQKQIKNVQRTFDHVDIIQGHVGRAEDMPRGQDEWTGIMKFWGGVLVKSEGWKGGGEVFEVMR
ncbi:Alpha/Beta hydrolase protein [Kockovaella imperatae]|uniref:Alpha/Beta hydrolase protein n=1 Tax=Kockovaella imperatae TaxID=4999 RepID=A0A1Y1UK41_9TREE|nr:Alpha/Beta hydrolase protein [Kockovaella imperatae]ORX38352.1 Alpha/Beta hydrolase protein [Kockovaella imperatae]